MLILMPSLTVKLTMLLCGKAPGLRQASPTSWILDPKYWTGDQHDCAVQSGVGRGGAHAIETLTSSSRHCRVAKLRTMSAPTEMLHEANSRCPLGEDVKFKQRRFENNASCKDPAQATISPQGQQQAEM